MDAETPHWVRVARLGLGASTWLAQVRAVARLADALEANEEMRCTDNDVLSETFSVPPGLVPRIRFGLGIPQASIARVLRDLRTEGKLHVDRVKAGIPRDQTRFRIMTHAGAYYDELSQEWKLDSEDSDFNKLRDRFALELAKKAISGELVKREIPSSRTRRRVMMAIGAVWDAKRGLWKKSEGR